MICVCGHAKSSHAGRDGIGRFCTPCFNQNLGHKKGPRSFSDHYYKQDNLKYLEQKYEESLKK